MRFNLISVFICGLLSVSAAAVHAFPVASYENIEAGKFVNSLKISCERNHIYVQLHLDNKKAFSGYAPQMPCKVSQKEQLQSFSFSRWISAFKRHGPRRLKSVLQLVTSENESDATRVEKSLASHEQCRLFDMALSKTENLVFYCTNKMASYLPVPKRGVSAGTQTKTTATTTLSIPCSCETPFSNQAVILKALPKELLTRLSKAMKTNR